MIKAVQPSVWESVPTVGVIGTSREPVGVNRRHSRRMKSAQRALPAGQSITKVNGRWRAFWSVDDGTGRRRRPSKRFDSERAALDHLATIPQRVIVAQGSPRTLADALTQFAQRGRATAQVRWVQAECQHLLGVRLDDPGLAVALDRILTLRAERRQPQGRPTARWELAAPVREGVTGWQFECPTAGWCAVAQRRDFAANANAAVALLAQRHTVTESELAGGRQTARNLAQRGVIRRAAGVNREAPDAVSRTTVLACRAMLAQALPASLCDALPKPDEVKGVRESKVRRRKRELTRALGGRGLQPDPVALERVLREVISHGVAPQADGESAAHLNARRGLALIAASGMRSGELRALQWGAVDIAGNRLWIDASLDQRTGKRKAPKTEESQRELRIEYRSLRGLTDGLIEHLRQWRGDAGDTAWVAPGKDAAPVRREALLDALAEVTQALGLPKGLRVHDLRHCWARYALHTCGVDAALVSKALGHASIVITLTLYGSATAGLME